MKNPTEEQIQKFNEKCNSFITKDNLICFIYVLLRDDIAPGRIEQILINMDIENHEEYELSNGWLGHYAQYITNRLRNGKW